MLAALAAVGSCLWASRPPASGWVRRRAFVAAASPVALGAAGAAFGLIVWLRAGAAGAPWAALGKVCWADDVLATVPLIWSVLLLRGGHGSNGPKTVERAA